MCSSEAKVTVGVEVAPVAAVARINGRPVLQPTCNRVPSLDRRNSWKKPAIKATPPPPPPLPSLPKLSSANLASKPRASLTTPPISPKSKSPRPPAIKRGNETNGLNLSSEKVAIPRSTTRSLERKKSKSFKEGFLTVSSDQPSDASLSYASSLIVEAPGSIAAVRREQMALQHAQRKMRIAHYGRSKSAKFESKVVPLDSSASSATVVAPKNHEEEKRCSFITANSDPIYVTYHDEEWGAPVHDDKMLFELLVLSGAQVGSDWTSILKKRQDFRDAFSGFDAETVGSLTDKHMMSISSQYGIDISRVRGVVDNSNRILEIKREFGSFDKYIWGFVNHKPISTQYKFGHKIPVKTSKSESISKDKTLGWCCGSDLQRYSLDFGVYGDALYQTSLGVRSSRNSHNNRNPPQIHRRRRARNRAFSRPQRHLPRIRRRQHPRRSKFQGRSEAGRYYAYGGVRTV